MTRVNKICMSVLMLGAAAFAVPAMAQSAGANNGASASQNADADNGAATSSGQAMNSSAAAADNAQTNAAADASTSPSAGNSQTAMNSSAGTDANASGNFSSVNDTSKKYRRATRARDFRAEKKVTQQLNQQASAAAQPNQQTAMNQ